FFWPIWRSSASILQIDGARVQGFCTLLATTDKKLDQSQSDISRYLKPSKLQPKACNISSSTTFFFFSFTAITHFVAEADLPFSIVERKLFHNLIRLTVSPHI
ncbi:uncharacterized protein VP01_7947g1, partial [Puccinia sorghi]